MLGQVKKLLPPDFGARFGAWWDGRDYAPVSGDDAGDGHDLPAEGEAGHGEHAAAPPSGPPPRPAAIRQDAFSSSAPVQPSASRLRGPETLRVRALETLWGEGRYAPASDTLDQRLLDALFDSADTDSQLGFVGADAALINACRSRTDRTIHAAEWRAGCAERSNELVPGVSVLLGEVDRPRGLPEGGLGAALSIDAFAYADHKAGLVARVFRSLGPQGRWVIVDTIRHTKKAPAEPFASAFAEPQLAAPDEIGELLSLAGFQSVQYLDLTADVLAAAAGRYAMFARMMEEAVRSGMNGRDGALFLQELSWEARAWRARMRALEGGALGVGMWVADKPAGGKAVPGAALAGAVETRPAPAKPKAPPKPAPQPAAPPAKAAAPVAARAAAPVAAAPPPPAPAPPADDDLDWDLGGGEAMDQSAVDSLFD